jgi:bifunctional UDP-N-acetylglucosamine pyrophosphorylase/glucosamine-1-phosphate N-acetyltransferase
MSSAGRTFAVVLAAGGGTRMKSDFPKVLHRVAGRPLLAHILTALQPVPFDRRVVVTPPDHESIGTAIAASGLADGLEYVVQQSPTGTADAVRIALDALDEPAGTVVVAPADSPLLSTETFRGLLKSHRARSPATTVLTAILHNPTNYGRVIRGSDDSVEGVVEDRDATEAQKRITEVSAGVYAFDLAMLASVIDKVDRENQQGEYYLPDVIPLLRSQGASVVAFTVDESEVAGANSRSQLAWAGAMLRKRVCEHWLDQGVTVVDPETTYIDTSVKIAQDAVIHPFTFLEGETTVGRRAEVGPQSRIVDSVIDDSARVSFSVVVGSLIGPGASVGPFASLRAGTRLEKNAKVGTFVETKQTTLGEDSKANHLAYLGDAEVGRGVNVGAGSITCNWDGQEKHKTVIEDDAYIGSDTMFVAPTRIGKRAATGAGAVVRGDVPDDALAVGVPARVIEGKGNKMAPKQRDEAKKRRE